MNDVLVVLAFVGFLFAATGAFLSVVMIWRKDA